MFAWLSSAAYASSTFMPPEGTQIASYVDGLYKFLILVSFVSCVLVIGGLVYFAIKFKRNHQGEKTAYISHNHALEFAWSFIPFVIFMVVFAWGWWIYTEMRTFPRDSLEITVVGQKWNWDFLYKSGRKVSNELYVPVDTPVKLIMASRDVLHSFFIPSFRVKQDVVPGRYTALWFQANKAGNYQVFCTEFCGAGHSAMLAKVHVLPKKEYEEWLEKDPYKGLDLTQIGQKVYTGKCVACHNVNAEKKVGPGFAGIFGRQEALEDGQTVTVDENYIRESILSPNSKIVKGFQKGLMPTFAGQLSEQELMGLITYLKSLKN